MYERMSTKFSIYEDGVTTSYHILHYILYAHPPFAVSVSSYMNVHFFDQLTILGRKTKSLLSYISFIKHIHSFYLQS